MARNTIDRGALLDAAVRVARRVGLDRMSMRMVAEELGVSPMAAYRHVASRDELVSLVADELAADIQVPPPESGTWDERLRELERAAFRSHSHIGQASAAVLTAGPNQRRIVNGVMDILTSAGFSLEDAVLAFEVIWAYFHGQLRVYENLRSRDRLDDDGRNQELWPRFAEIMDAVPRLAPEEYFDRGFEILLDGLRVRLAATCEATTT